MVMSWAFVNLKPGVAKSTSAIFTAQAFYDAGLSPLLIDADPGQSSLAWYERAGGFKWPVVGLDETDLYRKIPDIEGNRDVVLIDVPQVEDHARIARGALRYADTWILPVAPSFVEVDRMFAYHKGKEHLGGPGQLLEFLEDVQELRAEPADVVVSFNRTNTKKPTKAGPDAEVREVMGEKGLHVLETHIPFNDLLYRQAVELRPQIGTPFERLVKELLKRRKDVA